MNDFDLNLAIVWPEIPQNTGTIGRLCVATHSTLHLVKPLGFEITESRVRRAGLDYWKHLRLVMHESLEDFEATLPSNDRVFLIETKTQKTHYQAHFKKGSFIILGQETKGLPESFLQKYRDQTYTIPMWDNRVRSLNLSNAASIVTYEAIRQLQLGS